MIYLRLAKTTDKLLSNKIGLETYILLGWFRLVGTMVVILEIQSSFIHFTKSFVGSFTFIDLR